MWASVQVKTAGALPLDAADLRGRLRIDTAAEDTLLQDFLAAAASRIEGPDGVGIALMAQTWTLTIDAWAGEITLPGWPVTGVSEIRYLDADGATQALDHAAAFRLVAGTDPVRLVRKPGAALPATLGGRSVIEIDYTLGRADASAVDPGLVTAMALLAGHYYENREATVPAQVKELPMGVEHILARFTRGVVA
ncbi:head-tail connector protein [Phaeobacter gallaeciensis]|uniref:head-tail connector protein n=1 Tax=Phaeobacter gallaeciensis TaxID=60890 RepID=UPI00237FAA19|nr:head-tail connector protein [Phaeobacter gallaeciensis]MDE4059767.1 head-tail connector protein [Phaeobacter gallaeciensis]MDE4122596.1 head-tail connector protein [Phaeobacter gallaeciensis]MDE4127255.1 head-tail connector protein [Phaeobacter gallaeciensis]